MSDEFSSLPKYPGASDPVPPSGHWQLAGFVLLAVVAGLALALAKWFYFARAIGAAAGALAY